MCLEHKQYWQCCLTIDSRYIDPCPEAQVGFRCKIEERVHPIGGYCRECRKSLHKLEDDEVTSPMYTRNDDYDRPWEPRRYKPVRSQPLQFPTSRGPANSEQDRRSKYFYPSNSKELVHVPKDSHKYQGRTSTPAASMDPPTKRTSRRHRQHDQDSEHYDQVYDHYDRQYHDEDTYSNYNESGYQYTPSDHVYESAYSNHNYHAPDPPPSSKSKPKHHRHHHSRSPSPSRPPKSHHRSKADIVQWRVASPRTVKRLQQQGVLPSTEELQRMCIQARRED